MARTKSINPRCARQRRVVLASFAAITGLAGWPAAAQAGAADASDAEPAAHLEEIIVTARKREESFKDVPVSVAVLSNAVLERYDLTSFEKIAASTPDLTIARASNGSAASISMRGIGSSFTSIGIEQSVAAVVDGIYFGQGRIINEDFYDIRQVELLKGPQSLFFGKNASAGVISVVSMDPTPKFESYVKVGYETQAEQPIYEGMVSGPLSDTFSARLAVRGSNMYRGYVENVSGPEKWDYLDVATGNTGASVASPADRWGPDENSFAGRLTLKYVPNDTVSNTTKLSGNRTETGNASWNYIIYDCPSAGAPTPCGRSFTNAMNNLPAAVAATFPLADAGGILHNDYDSLQVTNATKLDFRQWNLTSALNYQRFKNVFSIDADYYSSPTSTTWADESDTYDAYSAEVRGQTTWSGPFNFLLGGLYQGSKLDSMQAAILAPIENTAAPLTQNLFESFGKVSSTRGETFSVFLQGTWAITDQWELSAGGRYTHETKKSLFGQPYVNPALAGLFVQGKFINADQAWNNFSPEATLTFKATDNVTIYGAYKTGYKSGGFSNSAILTVHTTASDFQFNPEKPRGFEIGVKSELMDRTLNLSATAYDYTFKDLQLEVFNSTLVSFVAGNAGSATTRGLEIEGEWLPIASLTLNGSINYNQAKYQDFANAPCYAGETIAQGCSVVGGEVGVTQQDLSGKQTADAPRFTANVGANWNADIPLGHLVLSTNARFSGAYNISQYNDPRTIQAAYAMLDGSAKLVFGDGSWQVAVIGRNLTDRFVLTGTLDVVGGGSGTGTAAGIPANQAGLVTLPRTVLLQLEKRF